MESRNAGWYIMMMVSAFGLVIAGGLDNQCVLDGMTATACLYCSKLPNGRDIPMQHCCRSPSTFQLCHICIEDEVACEAMFAELDSMSDSSVEDEEDSREMEKRYGRIWLGRGKSFGKRSIGYDLGNEEIEKRYGKLFLDGRKRFGSFLLGKGSHWKK
ncbi:hypothetical protein CHS0354_016877 [Potamilus streckersoni]|uniref:Uncharacterized protein n=1 Tax=Potamilus streckersoni TaxID=2493646 RepID=A0AAE0S881_9BIVA|nr:hypothetical protein CHS0354_016877 [Potamilus streckersoni]